jgi:hypothetical protein
VTDSDDPTCWRKSSYSDTTNCVEVRSRADGTIVVRNSNDTGGRELTLTRYQMGAWLAGCKEGEFDDLL